MKPDFIRPVILVLLALAARGMAQDRQPWRDPAARDALWNARGCTDDTRGRWFRDAKFGAFIHFGPYSHLGGYWQGELYRPSEQIIGLGKRKATIPPDQYRKEVCGAFNPENFDARLWVDAIKRAGQRYVIATAKHHDGFCMFRTATTSYNIVEATPFKRDFIKELADECHRQGIVFCPYYSIGDWSASAVQGPGFASYKEYMFAQLRELLTNYGDVRMLWFDNFWYVDGQWKNDPAHAMELYAFARSVRPELLVNDRCGRGKYSQDGDYSTPENQLKGSRQSRYFEVVMTNTKDDNWAWVRTAANYRTPQEIIRNLIDCTSKGGNFVLNVGPTASGEFPKEHLTILDATGKWLAANGEAVYGAEPAPECAVEGDGDFRCYATRKDGAIYLHIVQWPENGELTVRIARPHLVAVEPLDPSLPAAASTRDEQADGVSLKVKRRARTDPYATVLKLRFGP
jgi:alpha-L-fucosidase